MGVGVYTIAHLYNQPTVAVTVWEWESTLLLICATYRGCNGMGVRVYTIAHLCNQPTVAVTVWE